MGFSGAVMHDPKVTRPNNTHWIEGYKAPSHWAMLAWYGFKVSKVALVVTCENNTPILAILSLHLTH